MQVMLQQPMLQYCTSPETDDAKKHIQSETMQVLHEQIRNATFDLIRNFQFTSSLIDNV